MIQVIKKTLIFACAKVLKEQSFASSFFNYILYIVNYKLVKAVSVKNYDLYEKRYIIM